jgi:hypothetical protein
VCGGGGPRAGARASVCGGGGPRAGARAATVCRGPPSAAALVQGTSGGGARRNRATAMMALDRLRRDLRWETAKCWGRRGGTVAFIPAPL